MVRRTMRTPTPWLLALVAAGAAAGGAESACTPQERVAGPITQFIDGDSFEIGSTAIRLHGIDAPEGRQPCMRDDREWRCGDAAAAELRRLAGSRSLSCVQRDVDDYGRIVAVCHVGTTDLGGALVRAGFAVAYRRYSDDYVDEEREAQAARRGVWAGEFTAPAQFRRDARRAAAPARRPAPDTVRGDSRPSARGRTPPDPDCPIKGNVNDEDERIYHVPGTQSYDNTVIDEAQGERWFCSEAEARREGWRPPRG